MSRALRRRVSRSRCLSGRRRPNVTADETSRASLTRTRRSRGVRVGDVLEWHRGKAPIGAKLKGGGCVGGDSGGGGNPERFVTRRIVVLGGSGLPKVDRFGSCDPFVIVYWNHEKLGQVIPHGHSTLPRSSRAAVLCSARMVYS